MAKYKPGDRVTVKGELFVIIKKPDGTLARRRVGKTTQKGRVRIKPARARPDPVSSEILDEEGLTEAEQELAALLGPELTEALATPDDDDVPKI